VLSKNKIKFISSLQHKKYRQIHNAYIMEGEKIIRELLLQDHHHIIMLFSTKECATLIEPFITGNDFTYQIISPAEMKKISQMKKPPGCLAVANPPASTPDNESVLNSLSLILDTVQDPGNLGNIIRIASWFGISRIFCSESSADCYNPKVVQACMGAILRTEIYYRDLLDLFTRFKISDFPVYGTFTEGTSIYSCKPQKRGFIVLGNESKGISPLLHPFIGHRLTIPPYPPGNRQTESLNIASAAAIVCSEFRRGMD